MACFRLLLLETIKTHWLFWGLAWLVSSYDGCWDKMLLAHGTMSWETMTGWWFQTTPEKYDFVSWDDEIPNWMEK